MGTGENSREHQCNLGGPIMSCTSNGIPRIGFKVDVSGNGVLHYIILNPAPVEIPVIRRMLLYVNFFCLSLCSFIIVENTLSTKGTCKPDKGFKDVTY